MVCWGLISWHVSLQGPYDAVWHRPQPTSHPFSFQGDGPAMSQVQAQAQANLGLLPSNSGTLPEALHDPTLAFQVRTAQTTVPRQTYPGVTVQGKYNGAWLPPMVCVQAEALIMACA